MSRARRSILRTVLPLVALVALAGVATAQPVPGITFKIRTQLRNNPEPTKSRPDSVRIKRVAAEQAARAADIDVGTDVAAAGGGRGATGGGRGGANNVLNMNGSFIKGMGRMDVQGVIGSPELQATQSALFTDTSTTIIDDVEKTWWPRVFDIGSILAFTSAIDATTAPRKVGSLTVSWDSLPSETYEGRPAKHYQMKMSYGFTQPTREDSLKVLAVTTVTSDYWVVNLPVNFENRFAGIGRPRRQMPDSLLGEWQKMLKLYTELGKGTIVKFQATGLIGENSTGATQYTRTMEMTGIREVQLDPATLKVPADYTRAATGRGRGGS